jgi:hypothetical protein
VTGSRELNNFDLGDGDFAILGLNRRKKHQNFQSGIRRTAIYGNFLMIAEE